MKRKAKQILAAVLSMVFLLSSVPVDLVRAEDQVSSTAGNDLIVNDDQQLQESSDLNLKYFLVDRPQLAASGIQNIVVSLEEDSAKVENLRLVSVSEEGKEQIWECTKSAGNAYLFSRKFEEAESGTYNVEKIIYTLQGQEHEEVLLEDGIEASFDVAPEAAVMSVDTDSEENVVQVENAAQAEQQVEDALETVAAEPKANGNVVIVLDPGHDEISPGAQSQGLSEEVLVLKIAQYCREELEKYSGVEVYMTREDMSCPANIPAGQHSDREGECLERRVEIAAEKNADIFVSIHLNAFGNSSARGAEVYYPTDNWKPEVGQEGEGAAASIQKELAALGLYDRGIVSKDCTDGDQYPDGSLEDYYSVIRNSKKAGFPGLIVEHAFITSTSDAAEYLTTESGLKKLGVADAKGLIDYYGLTIDDGKWELTDGKYYYRKADGTLVTDTWKRIGGKMYRFDKNAVMQTGWYEEDGKRYYLGTDGAMRTDWNVIDGVWYYFGQDGVMRTGWQYLDGYWFYLTKEGKMLRGWQEIEGQWYYLDSSGHMLTGWQYIEDSWYYMNGSGHRLTGWQYIGSQWFYLTEEGKMLTGWQKIDDTWYYMNSSGYRLTDWQYLGNHWFYFDKEGKMLTGWQYLGNHWFYMNSAGYMLTGWQLIDNDWYYMNGSGYRLTSWQIINGNWYYFDEKDNDRMIQPGWQIINGSWYYFAQSGAMCTGWVHLDEGWYYFHPSGYMLTGWQQINGKWYYLNPYGVSPAGLMIISSKRTIGGRTYYFDGSGAMRTGWIPTDDGWYFAEEDGSFVTGWKQISGTWYYFDPSEEGRMADSGWKEIDSNQYYFSSNGAMHTGWIQEGENWYYLNETGFMVKNDWVLIKDDWYYFYADGHMAANETIDGWQIGPSGAMIDPAKDKMEEKVNGLSSATNYLIAVDVDARKTGIFYGSQGSWNTEHFWACSVGASDTPTPRGTYTIGIKGYYFENYGCRCYYYTQFLGDYLFHSVPYYPDGTVDERMGMGLSHGCVRLPIDRAKWIYDNIPQGTKVVIY